MRAACARAIVCVVVCAAAPGAVSQTALAAPSAPSPSPRRVVEVITSGATEDTAALQDTLRELLGRLDLSLDARSVESGPRDEAAVLALVRVHLGEDSGRVVVVDFARGRQIADRTVHRDASLAVFHEALAHVVLSSVEPVLAAERERRAPPPSAPPAIAPPATAPPLREVPAAAPVSHESRSPWAFEAATTGGGGPFASGSGVVASIGGAFGMTWRRGVHPSVALSGRYDLPFDVGTDVVQTHTGVGAFRATTGLELLAVGRLGIDAAVGAGVDVLTVTSRSSVLPQGRLEPSTTRVDPVLTSSVAARLGLASSVDLLLAFAVDADLAQRRYVTDAGGNRSVVFEPWRVRPFLSVGFAFTLAGPSRYEASLPEERK